MKKIITIVLTFMLVFILFGCSSENTKTDITNRDALYEYVNSEIYKISREDFDNGFEISFMDVTNDGKNEALLVNNLDWASNIEIVTVNGKKYENIKTDLQVQKYKNEFEMQDGFLKVVQSSGGSGLAVEVMSLLKYDKGRMVTVLQNMEISLTESHPTDWRREHNAQINGPLTDFEYILTKDDNGVKSVERKRYIYNKDTLSYKVENIDTNNIAIKNYQGEGLERLSKKTIDTNDDYVYTKGEVQDTLAIFGEVTNVKVEYIRLYTEGNQHLLDEFDTLKDTELTIPRDKNPDDLIIVSFYDKGLRSHLFTFTSNKGDDYIYSDAEDTQELTASLEEKYQKATSYEDKSYLLVNSLGMSVKEFLASNNFNNIQEDVDEYYEEKYYKAVNEPLGYDFIFNQYNDTIFNIYIYPNENYQTMKDDAKYSFFGIDFDMPIYQARYNLDKSKLNDNISLNLYESDENLVGINIRLNTAK